MCRFRQLRPIRKGKRICNWAASRWLGRIRRTKAAAAASSGFGLLTGDNIPTGLPTSLGYKPNGLHQVAIVGNHGRPRRKLSRKASKSR